MDAVAVTQMFQQMSGNNKRSERVTYYARPADWRNPLWVVTNQTQPMIRFTLMEQGFKPLMQYGNTPPDVQGAARYGCAPHNSRELWTPILAHPKGPAEFPADQVMLMRWYRPEGLPGAMRGKRIRFPQFEAWVRKNGSFKEYRCPDCNDITFFRPAHLARHLHNSHGYDQAAIIALGTASGINFNEGLMSLVESVQTWDVPESDYEEEMAHTPPPDGMPIIVESLVLPNRDQVRQAQGQLQDMNDDPLVANMIAELKAQIADLKAQVAGTAKSTASARRGRGRPKKATATRRAPTAREQKPIEVSVEVEELEPALA